MPKNAYRLWTPIANAFEAYRRRTLAEPGAIYEHIWRLIHIQEALVVTLGSCLATRLIHLWSDSPSTRSQLNRLRVALTGISSPDEDSDLAGSGQSCLEGSIKAWIDLLQAFGRDPMDPTCPFCKAMAEYLSDTSQGQLAFLDAWKRIAPIPPSYNAELPRVQRFDAINAL